MRASVSRLYGKGSGPRLVESFLVTLDDRSVVLYVEDGIVVSASDRDLRSAASSAVLLWRARIVERDTNQFLDAVRERERAEADLSSLGYTLGEST